MRCNQALLLRSNILGELRKDQQAAAAAMLKFVPILHQILRLDCNRKNGDIHGNVGPFFLLQSSPKDDAKLAQSHVKWTINAELDIPFDGWGRMEVDLLCMKARLAIELDGAQHLGNAEAYRRDRRKDALLQEHGFTVLRFLAEDVSRHLDKVLDAILRALFYHEKASLR